jgi:ligand-binding sensor domain-containing protein
MKREFRFVLFLSASLLLATSFHLSLAQGFHLKTYTTKDGLSSSYVWSVKEDKLGYLWIGTPNGLNRFDGKNFINYGITDGLPDARTGAGYMDSHFRLWVNTVRGVTELKGDKFVTYPLSDSPKIRSSAVIETKKAKLWAMTTTGVYEFRGNKWSKLSLYPGYENHVCREILETKEGTYVNYGGLLVVHKPDNSWKIIDAPKEPLYYYVSVKESAGEVFASTIEGIFKIKNDHLEKLKGEPGNLKGVYSFLVDSKKRIWIGSESLGLRVVMPGDTVSRLVYKHPALNLISDIIEDKHGTIWVADFNGLINVTEAQYKIFTFPLITNTPAVRNMVQPPQGPIFINTGTLTIQENKGGKFVPRKLQLVHSVLPNDELIIDKYAFDDKNRYWYYLRGFALAIQDGNSVYEQSKELAPLGDQAFDVMWDNYRKKIVVAIRKQNFPCQYNEGRYSILPVENSIKIDGNIMRLHQCVDETILFATDTGSIYSINKQNVCRLQLKEFNSTGTISWFYNDPSGDVWIAYSGRGLRRYYWKNEQLVLKEELNTANGLSSNYVSALCFDDFGNLWVSSLGSITILKKKINDRYSPVASYEASDIGIDNPGSSSLTKDASGNIWMSTLQSVICFYTRKIVSYKATTPTILIENIRLNFQQTDWSKYADSLYSIFQLPYHFRFAHNQNNLGIYFKGISSMGSKGLQYCYKLEALDSSWSSPSSENYVSFVNLPPGKYVFKVRARLQNTNWSEPCTFGFEIKKPFWETWWFRLALIAVAATLIVFVFRYRLNQLKTKNQMQTQLHELKTKAFKLQMNPHFVHNALNSIQSLVLNNKSNEASIYINKFAKLLRQVLDNSDHNLISLDKELYSLQLYVDLEKLRMDVDVDYSVRLSESIIDSEIQIPPLILQPCIENALWHGLGKKKGDKKIVLTITRKRDLIICEITDNGIGRKKASELYESFPQGHLSKAVNIIRQRLIDFNQSTDIEPLSFIDLEKDGEPTGTTVIITIKSTFI